MALQLGDIAPDFEADTTEGRIKGSPVAKLVNTRSSGMSRASPSPLRLDAFALRIIERRELHLRGMLLPRQFNFPRAG